MTVTSFRPHDYPHFVIVGMMKCGTTTIYEHLTKHPRIKAAVAKELHYFTRDFVGRVPKESWGLEYGEALGRDPSEPGSFLYGEASPSYIAVPQRIHAFNPDAKIIIIMRDPVRRVISQIRQYESHQFLQKDGGYAAYLQAAEDLASVDVIEDSIYLPRIARYLDVFPAENIAFVSFEEFSADPVGIMGDLFGFLGLDPVEIDTSFIGAKTQAAPNEAVIEKRVSEFFETRRGAVYELLQEKGARLFPAGSPWFQKY